MSEDLLKCACGKQPKLEAKTSYSGGGRYKGQTRCDSWKVTCSCYRSEQTFPNGSTKEDSETARLAVIANWNARIELALDRKRSPDKLLWDLEHSGKHIKLALARLLRAVEERPVQREQDDE